MRRGAWLAAMCLAAIASAPSVRAVTPARAPAPKRPESEVEESPPAPLLIPGRADSTKKSRPQRAVDSYRLGLQLESDGQPEAALMAYMNAAILDSTIRDVRYRAGLLNLAADQLRDAVRLFSAELHFHPDHLDAAREYGIGLSRLGNPRAVKYLEGLCTEHAKDPACWHALGFAYKNAGRPRDAEVAFRSAIRLSPNRASTHRDLGVLLASLKRDREAREEYRRAAALDPGDPTTWYNLANLDRRAHKLDLALDGFRRAEAADSGFVLAMQGQIDVLESLGRLHEAGDVYRRWLALRPDDHGARLEAGRLYTRIGRPDVALEIAREGVRVTPRSGDARVVLALALQASGNSRAALAELRKAESQFRAKHEKQRVRELIVALRAEAPDSLRTVFDADSVAHPGQP